VSLNGEKPSEVAIHGRKFSIPYDISGLSLQLDMKVLPDGKISAVIMGNPVATLEKAK
jgi:hypothetical protein